MVYLCSTYEYELWVWCCRCENITSSVYCVSHSVSKSTLQSYLNTCDPPYCSFQSFDTNCYDSVITRTCFHPVFLLFFPPQTLSHLFPRSLFHFMCYPFLFRNDRNERVRLINDYYRLIALPPVKSGRKGGQCIAVHIMRPFRDWSYIWSCPGWYYRRRWCLLNHQTTHWSEISKHAFIYSRLHLGRHANTNTGKEATRLLIMINTTWHQQHMWCRLMIRLMVNNVLCWKCVYMQRLPMCIRLHAEVCGGGGDAASDELSCI